MASPVTSGSPSALGRWADGCARAMRGDRVDLSLLARQVFNELKADASLRWIRAYLAERHSELNASGSNSNSNNGSGACRAIGGGGGPSSDAESPEKVELSVLARRGGSRRAGSRKLSTVFAAVSVDDATTIDAVKCFAVLSELLPDKTAGQVLRLVRALLLISAAGGSRVALLPLALVTVAHLAVRCGSTGELLDAFDSPLLAFTGLCVAAAPVVAAWGGLRCGDRGSSASERPHGRAVRGAASSTTSPAAAAAAAAAAAGVADGSGEGGGLAGWVAEQVDASVAVSMPFDGWAVSGPTQGAAALQGHRSWRQAGAAHPPPDLVLTPSRLLARQRQQPGAKAPEVLTVSPQRPTSSHDVVQIPSDSEADEGDGCTAIARRSRNPPPILRLPQWELPLADGSTSTSQAAAAAAAAAETMSRPEGAPLTAPVLCASSAAVDGAAMLLVETLLGLVAPRSRRALERAMADVHSTVPERRRALLLLLRRVAAQLDTGLSCCDALPGQSLAKPDVSLHVRACFSLAASTSSVSSSVCQRRCSDSDRSLITSNGGGGGRRLELLPSLTPPAASSCTSLPPSQRHCSGGGSSSGATTDDAPTVPPERSDSSRLASGQSAPADDDGSSVPPFLDPEAEKERGAGGGGGTMLLPPVLLDAVNPATPADPATSRVGANDGGGDDGGNDSNSSEESEFSDVEGGSGGSGAHQRNRTAPADKYRPRPRRQPLPVAARRCGKVDLDAEVGETPGECGSGGGEVAAGSGGGGEKEAAQDDGCCSVM